MGLLFTLILGIFIIVGALIVFLTKNNDKFVNFSISLAFSVMIMLLITDLLPEAFEAIKTTLNFPWGLILVITLALVGFVILKVLDHFVPDHDDDLTTTEDDHNNLAHIGLVSSLALVLHNIIEGMAIYSTFSSSTKLGLLVSIGVGLHNIPLGMVIASTFYKANNSKKKTMMIITGISLSTFVGGLIMLLLGSLINELVLGILLSITIGMIFYIIFLELLPRMIHAKDKKPTLLGIGLGIIILLAAYFIG